MKFAMNSKKRPKALKEYFLLGDTTKISMGTVRGRKRFLQRIEKYNNRITEKRRLIVRKNVS